MVSSRILGRLLAAGLLLVAVCFGWFGSVYAQPAIQVFELFDENLMEGSGPVMSDATVRKSVSVKVVRGARDMAILSSTPDGTGIPNVDDFITINDEFVQGGFFIPLAVLAATGIQPDNPACLLNSTVSVDRCAFPRPHHHAVDVSDVIPVGASTVTVEIWDFGGGFGHTRLYLVIVPRPLQ
jgi:hypothetical protein